MIIMFDFDGVINKSEMFSVLYAREYRVSKDLMKAFFIKDFQVCARGESDIKKILPLYFKKWTWDHNVDLFLEYWFALDIQLDMELLAYIDSVLVRSNYLILASQQEVHRRNHIWENLKLKEKFDKCCCTCDVGYLKSDIRYFLKILENLKNNKVIKEAKEVCFFDDNPKFLEVANKTGIRTIHFQSNDNVYDIFGT